MSRTLRLVAALLAVACWLAAPAAAAELPAVPDPAAVAGGLNATAAGATESVASARPVRTAVKAIAEPVKTVAATRTVSTAVQTATAVRPVRAAVETAAAAGARVPPTADEAVRRVTETAAAPVERTAGPRAPSKQGAEPTIREDRGNAGGVTARAASLQAPATGADAGPRAAIPALDAPAAASAFQAATDFAGGAPSAADAAFVAALDHRSSPDPAPAQSGGASVAAGSASFLTGGLAVLLTTLALAGPALRRRLPRLTVTAWPSAFVPLLERPG